MLWKFCFALTHNNYIFKPDFHSKITTAFVFIHYYKNDSGEQVKDSEIDMEEKERSNQLLVHFVNQIWLLIWSE